MRKKIALLLLFLTSITWIVPAETKFLSGDDKIDEIQKRIDEEKKKKEKEKENKDQDNKSENTNGGNCMGSLFSACLEGICRGIAASSSASDSETDSNSGQSDAAPKSGGCSGFGFLEDFCFAPFPHAPGWGNDIVGWSADENNPHKLGYLSASVDGSYLYGNTGSVNAQLEAAFLILHLNGFYQYTYAETKTMNMFSVNGGIAIPLQFALFNAFCGVFYYDYIGTGLFSFGASAKILLPANLVLDVYNLNAFYYSLGFHIVSASLNLAIDRFSIGAGYRYHNYAGVVFQGPELKLSVWL